MNEFRALGFDGPIEFATSDRNYTRFEVAKDQDGEPHGKIVVGPDIMPGKGTNPNATMDRRAAAAHEITHCKRWETGTACDVDRDLDEAQTDLQAICYFKEHLGPSQIESLITDALERLVRLERRLEGGES